MTRWLPLSLTLALSLAPAPLARADDEKLQGSWAVIAAEEDGKPAERLKGHVLTFAGDRFTITQDGKVLYQGTFTLAPEKKPAAFDFRHTEGLCKGQTWKGIYAQDGDTLKMCDNAPNPARGRPEEFAAKAGSGYVLLTFKRVKKP